MDVLFSLALIALIDGWDDGFRVDWASMYSKVSSRPVRQGRFRSIGESSIRQESLISTSYRKLNIETFPFTGSISLQCPHREQ
jgi:hypothetical protein